jgi:hypothetical protein
MPMNQQKFPFSIAFFLVILLIGCISKSTAAYTFYQSNIITTNFSMKNPVFNLDNCLAFRNLSMEEIRRQFSISEENIEHNVKYEKLTQLTKLHNQNYHPGHFYFRDGKLVILYIGKNEQLEALDPKFLQNKFAEEGIRLRSRSGKTFNHYVYPEKGAAFSADSHSVRFIEIFPPTSLEAYKAEIYEEPQPFIK